MTEKEKGLVEAGLIYPEEDDVPMIPKHEAETVWMHLSRTNRNMTVAIVAVCVAMVAMAYIFVTGYTSRTKDWLNTYAALQGKPAVTEVDNGIQQQSSP